MKSTDPIPELSAWPISPHRAPFNFSSLGLSATQQQNPLIRPACLQKLRWLQSKGPQYIWQVIGADISVRGAAKGHDRGSAELFYLDLNSIRIPAVWFLMNYLSIRQLYSYLLHEWEQRGPLNLVIHDGALSILTFLQRGQIVLFNSHEMSTWHHNCFPALWFQTATVKNNWATHRVTIKCYFWG